MDFFSSSSVGGDRDVDGVGLSNCDEAAGCSGWFLRCLKLDGLVRRRC